TESWALGTGAPMKFTFSDAGTKNVRLRVRDSLGRTASAVNAVVVAAASATPTPTPTPTATPSPTATPTPSPTPTATPTPTPTATPTATPTPAAPHAAFSFSPSSPTAGQQVTFSLTGAASCAATPCSYSWDDVGPDGTDNWALGTGTPMRFTFSDAGSKYVRLTVTDSLGRAANATQTVAVVAAATPTPT